MLIFIAHFRVIYLTATRMVESLLITPKRTHTIYYHLAILMWATKDEVLPYHPQTEIGGELKIVLGFIG